MGLKPWVQLSPLIQGSGFRRTLVGLKPSGSFSPKTIAYSFRRTLVGLKLQIQDRAERLLDWFQTDPCGVETRRDCGRGRRRDRVSAGPFVGLEPDEGETSAQSTSSGRTFVGRIPPTPAL